MQLGKSTKNNDLLSVIEDEIDSFGSGEELLEEFKQFGL